MSNLFLYFVFFTFLNFPLFQWICFVILKRQPLENKQQQEEKKNKRQPLPLLKIWMHACRGQEIYGKSLYFSLNFAVNMELL
jgi:hypothetical protein